MTQFYSFGYPMTESP